MRIIDADMLKEKKCKLCIDKHCGDGYVCGDINLINNIPTISQWIPVSEMLPHNDDTVLVSTSDKDKMDRALYNFTRMRIMEQPIIEPSKADCWGCKCSKMERSQWIPVSERFPKKGERVLVSVKTHVGEWIAFDYISPYYSGDNEPEWDGHWNRDVVAWMPLPEVYKGGANE